MPHIHEKIDYDADAFIVNANTVLLRMHEKHHIWLPPGGHVELDEEPQEAAVREAKEEVGLDITLFNEAVTNRFPDGEKELIVPNFMNRHAINETHDHISFVYFATSESREFTSGELEHEKTDQIRWFTREELDDPIYGVTERIKYYAKAALTAVA